MIIDTSETADSIRPLILLIDDDPSVTLVVSLLLKRLGYDVLIANTGTAGLALAGANSRAIRAVLLDMMLPDVEASAVFQGIHQIAPNLPIVVMSGLSDHEIEQRLREHTPAAVLAKPFGLDMMRTLLTGLTSRAAPDCRLA